MTCLVVAEIILIVTIFVLEQGSATRNGIASVNFTPGYNAVYDNSTSYLSFRYNDRGCFVANQAFAVTNEPSEYARS
jgi:hypothetical protein